MRKMIAYLFVILTIFALTLGISKSQARDKNDIAYKLMVIASPKFSDRDTVEARFRFILPTFTKNCSDVDNDTKAADMLVVVHNKIKEYGLGKEEGLLNLTNTLFRMTNEISIGAKRVNAPLRCSEIWAMYLTLREQGYPVEEARGGVTELALSLYGLF